MRYLVLLLLVCSALMAGAQTVYTREDIIQTVISTGGKREDIIAIDSLQLGPFSARKVVGYRLLTVTVFMDYDEFMRRYGVMWKMYRDGMKSLRKAKPGESVNADYEPRWLVIDSVYQAVTERVRTQDTVYVSNGDFSRVGLRTIIEFDDLIEHARCRIVGNESGNVYDLIIRLKIGWQRGPLQGWGGRRYFLGGTRTCFYEKSDWHS